VGLNRQVWRSVTIALFAGASMVLLALMSIFSVPISRADNPDDALTALMMGGSGMPTPSEFWQDGIITDYIDPATGGNYTPVLVPTPESFASTSVPTGLADLQAAMGQQATDQPYLVEGYSQSAVIAIDEEIQLMQSGQAPPDATFLLLGSLNRPDGGIFERFPGLVIPGTAGFDFNGAEPTDAGIPTIDIATQYDFFADFPQYPINGLADLNAIFGIIYARLREWPTARRGSLRLATLGAADRALRQRIRSRVHRGRQASRRGHDVLLRSHHRATALGSAAKPGRT
jgi:hypothetical protein